MKNTASFSQVFLQTFPLSSIAQIALTLISVILLLSSQSIIAKAQEPATATESSQCSETPITANQTVVGLLSSGDCVSPLKGKPADRYKFNGTAGQLVAIALNSQEFDPFLYLIGPDGKIVAQDDDSGQGHDSRIPTSGFQRLPETGTYIIEATTFGSPTIGSYTLMLVAGTNACAYWPTVDTTPYPYRPSYGNITISAPAGCAWQITSPTSWIKTAGISTGLGDNSTSILVTANNGVSARSGLIYVAGIAYTITQHGNPKLCPASSIPAGVTMRGSLGNGDCASAFRVAPDGVPLADRYSLRLAPGQKIAVTMLSSFEGRIHFVGPDATWFGESPRSADGYTRFPATGFETIYSSGDYLIEVTSLNARQAGEYSVMLEIVTGSCKYTVTPQPKIMAFAGDTGSVQVVTTNGCQWHALGDSDWITFPSGSGGNGSNTLEFTTLSNPNAQVRSGRIYVGGEFITLTQLGYNPVASLSAASFSSKLLAPGSIVASFGTGMATTTETAETVPLPTSLAGTQVTIKDSKSVVRTAGLFFISPDQVNFLMPSDMAEGVALITVTSGDGTVLTGATQIRNVAPGLFSASGDGNGFARAQVLRIKPDGTQIYEPVARFDEEQGAFVAVPIDFGQEGDRLILVLFGTGWQNQTDLQSVAIRASGVFIHPLYAGPQGDLLGVDQINVELPHELAGRGELSLFVTVQGNSSNKVKVSFK